MALLLKARRLGDGWFTRAVERQTYQLKDRGGGGRNATRTRLPQLPFLTAVLVLTVVNYEESSMVNTGRGETLACWESDWVATAVPA